MKIKEVEKIKIKERVRIKAQTGQILNIYSFIKEGFINEKKGISI